MKKVVQLISSNSVYNDHLQFELSRSESFNCQYENICLNIGEITEECARKYHFRSYSFQSIPEKLIFRIFFNFYMIKNYSYLRGSIANIQYVDWFYLVMMPFLKRTFTWIVVTFWGSDLLRIGKLKILVLKLLLKHIDIIVLLTDEIVEIFQEKFGVGFDDKIRVARFGNPYLNLIDEITKEELVKFKKKYGIDTERKVIVLGYNRGEVHRHLEIISSMINAGIDRDKVFIVIPWTYGECKEGYKDQVEDVISDKYDSVFLEEFLEDEEIAALRCITSVIVNVQLTDVMSASMYETLYAGGEVITGSWLPYNDVYERGVVMRKVDRVKDVGRMLSEVLNRPLPKENIERNKEVIGKLYKWDYNIEKWVKLYSGK